MKARADEARQKSYGDKDKVVKDESEAERKTRIWVEEDVSNSPSPLLPELCPGSHVSIWLA